MSNSNWWAQRLGGQQAPVPAQRPTYTPPPQPVPARPAASPMDPSQRRLPDSAPSAGRCPGCGGGNYVQVGGVVTDRGTVPAMRCYDCGYPLTQSGTGISGVAPTGPTQKATQIANGGWNPGTIIGHL